MSTQRRMSPPNQPKEHNDDETKQVVDDTIGNRIRKRSTPPATEEDETNAMAGDVIPTSVCNTAQSGDADRKEAETDSDVLPRDKTPTYVCYSVLMDGRQTRNMTIHVSNNDYIDSIIDEIRKRNSVLLASVDPSQIELFTSAKQEEPLNALEKWKPGVTWGTEAMSLIV